MTLEDCIAKIETLRFQVQFSVLSGYNSLLLSFSMDPTVQRLLAILDRDADAKSAIEERIAALLERVESETQLSLDESIAAYLYCLKSKELSAALDVSQRIIETPGTFWARQMAYRLLMNQAGELAAPA